VVLLAAGEGGGESGRGEFDKGIREGLARGWWVVRVETALLGELGGVSVMVKISLSRGAR